MRVLVACEFSGIVRDAFRNLGHDAWSCDYRRSEVGGSHYQCDVLTILDNGWDLMIAHPPCTHLCVSGARWFKEKREEQQEAIIFVEELINCKIPRICIENPIGILSTVIRQPDQIIQPWQFGHNITKATCLWLKNLPLLHPTKIIEEGLFGRELGCHVEPPGPHREMNRSRTYKGIAQAMAQQWGNLSQTQNTLF